MKFTVILTPDKEDGGYVAECAAIPGCISEGNTVEEALRQYQRSDRRLPGIDGRPPAGAA
jgi:predicted RNase H-like HicB family nuclease